MARKPKATRTAEAATTVAEPELPALETAPAPARRGRPRKVPQAASPTPPEDSNDAAMEAAHADMANADMANGSEMHASDRDQNAAAAESATEATPMPAASKPAAQWDRTTDTAHFDWSEIERTASQQGPNQVMAKLLLAARDEGANSRWPF